MTNIIENIKVGDLYLDPFHYVRSKIGKTSAIAKITEVGEMKTRFGKPDRIVRYEKYVPKEGSYGVLKFIENSSVWAGDLKKKIPDNFSIVYEK